MYKWVYSIVFILCGCNAKNGNPHLAFKKELKKPLLEISGMITDGDKLYAVADKPKPVFYRINKNGEVEQEIHIVNVQVQDVEAITADENNFYIGDIGDNDGNRRDRKIVTIPKVAISEQKIVNVHGNVIQFFLQPDEADSVEIKKNNRDCEAMVSFGDSIYLFTKRRSDKQTEVFSVPKIPGQYTSKSIRKFDCVGLVTDAAINTFNNELALTGYNKGHRFPFIIFFTNFKQNDFFSGKMERIELADKNWDWQIESITYGNDNLILFANEQTKEVNSTLYAIKREKIRRINKSK